MSKNDFGLNSKESCLHCFPTFWNPTLSLKSVNKLHPTPGNCSAYVVNIIIKGHAFKVCVHYFHISIFSPNDGPSKTMKNGFYFI